MKRHQALIIAGFKDCLLWTKDYEKGLNYQFTSTANKRINTIINKFIELSNLYYISDDSFNCSSLTTNLFEQIGYDLYLTICGHGTGFWDREEIYLNGLHTSFTNIVDSIANIEDYYIVDTFINDEGLIDI